MSTKKETIEYMLEKLGEPDRFSTRAMFGEYALYADGTVVGLVCDDQLYIKIMPESVKLEAVCDKDTPYPGAKQYYLIEEDQLSKLDNLPDMLIDMAKAIPVKKTKQSKKFVKKKVNKK